MPIGRFGAALLLSLAVVAGIFFAPSHRWDTAVTMWLQRAAPLPDVPAAALVFLGNAEVSITALALAALLLWRRERRRAGDLVWLTAGMLAASGVALALKWVVPHPGPPPEFQRAVHRAGLSVPQLFSFPSGHTMRTTFFAITALRRTPFVGAALVIAMMTALVYLGDHWLSDVLGGVCLGWASAEPVRALRGRLR